jgi:phenylacetic acid degradation operon negative regulatory protein
MVAVHARSALFDVYGDHLRRRGGLAPVAALARLLAPLGVSVPAVRTAVSRMVRQGWLEPVLLPDGAGYQLTSRAERRLDAAHARIYRTPSTGWDGQWHLASVDRPVGRAARLVSW